MKKLLFTILIAAGLIGSAPADTFGTGANQFSIDFTTIGNPGNGADPKTGYGSVPYSYGISIYETSYEQVLKANLSGLNNVDGGAWRYNEEPVFNISWFEAAAYVNWLNTSTGHQAAYNLNYSNGWSMKLWSIEDSWNKEGALNMYRNKNSYYFLPTENEWYKAAYHKNDGVTSNYWAYATGSSIEYVSSGTNSGTAVYNVSPYGTTPAPINQAGGLSAYGTMAQSGNINEWTESPYSSSSPDVNTADRVYRGGYYTDGGGAMLSSRRYAALPSTESTMIGFRVASVVPEPSTYALFGIGAIGVLMAMRRKMTV